jgi:serine/threonine protein kinase
VNDYLQISGSTLSGYRVNNCIGIGAFGYVYEADDIARNAKVALKILAPYAGLEPLQEFIREGQLLLRLASSSHVVDYMGSHQQMFAAQTTSLKFPLRFHVLERADGDLAELSVGQPALPWTDRLALLRDVALAIHQMHLKQIAHRDLKASNCLLFLVGQELFVKVGDLGRSRHLTDSALAAPIAYQGPRGDPSHAAPEFFWAIGDDRPVTHLCADMYGLGSLIVEMTIGQSMTVMAQSSFMPIGISGDVNVRRDQYFAEVPSIRSRFESVFIQVEHEMPASIRQQGGQLLRQLCDPDPMRRFQLAGLERRNVPIDGVHWVLKRIDVLRKTLRNARAQQERLAQKKGVRP